MRLAANRVPVPAEVKDPPETSGLGGLHTAMTDGTLDGYRASVVAFELDYAPADVAHAVVTALTPHLGQDCTALRQRTRRLIARISPDLLRQRAQRARATTGLRRWVTEPGVDTWLGTFPSEDAATAWAAIDQHAHHLLTAGTCSSIEQARGKALTDLVTGNATIDVQIVLTVPADGAITPAAGPVAGRAVAHEDLATDRAWVSSDSAPPGSLPDGATETEEVQGAAALADLPARPGATNPRTDKAAADAGAASRAAAGAGHAHVTSAAPRVTTELTHNDSAASRGPASQPSVIAGEMPSPSATAADAEPPPGVTATIERLTASSRPDTPRGGTHVRARPRLSRPRRAVTATTPWCRCTVPDPPSRCSSAAAGCVTTSPNSHHDRPAADARPSARSCRVTRSPVPGSTPQGT